MLADLGVPSVGFALCRRTEAERPSAPSNFDLELGVFQMHRATIEIEVQRPIRVTFVQQRRHVAFNRVNSPANLSFGGLLFVAFYVVVFELFVLKDEEFGKPTFEGHYPLLRLLLQPPLQRKQHGRLTYHFPRLFPFKCFSHHPCHPL